MTDKEAMKLALDALDIAQGMLADLKSQHQPKMLSAYTAIKERLAKPEQEPAAWAVFEGCNAHDLYLPQEHDEALKMAGYKGDHAEVKPLYTTPPAAQRQWVELTDGEIDT